MKRETKSFFWPSYVDVMTALFVVMLLLFVLSYKVLLDRQRELEDINKRLVVELAEKKVIDRIQESIKRLPQDYFAYDEKYKRFSLMKQIQFPRGSSIIPAVDLEYLKQVGVEIASLIDNLKRNDSLDITYMIIIEGMASIDFPVTEYSTEFNYQLSYDRARSLFLLWKNHRDPKVREIFNSSFCEILTAGSGEGGIGRNQINYENGIPDDTKNQKILIQIIPKIGTIN